MIALLTAFGYVAGSAQTNRNFSLEDLGASGSVGVSYDSRIRGNQGLGYRVGLG